MLRLLSLNLQHALPGAGAADAPDTGVAGADIRDPEVARAVLAALAGQIAELAPDVVALQEVDKGQARSGRLDQAAVLAELLGWEHHRFAATYAGPVAGLRRRPRRSALATPADDALGLGRALLGRPPAGFGNALLSRRPVAAWRVRRLGRGPATLARRADRPAWDPRGYELATSTMTAAAMDAGWGMGALPPTTGFELLDEIPADVVQRLSDQGRALARQFSGPLGPPQSLMDQAVITVNDDTEIPMRLVFTLTALGLIPGMDAPAAIPRHLRVSRNSRWVRVDAPFGSAYHSSGINLLAL